MRLVQTVIASATLVCAAGVSAQSSVQFQFDPDGSGAAYGSITADRFDWAPGTALAVGAIPTIPNDPFTLYYQANLSAVQLGSGNVFSQGTGGINFNAVAGFGERTAAVLPVGPGAIAGFSFDGTNPVNYFRICLGSGDNLSGAGFGCTAANAILTGQVTQVTGSTFSVGDFGNTGLLDSSGNDDWNGQLTVRGAGGTSIFIDVTSIDTTYFTSFNLAQALIVSFFNNNQNLPFTEIDPSKCMFDNDGACLNTVGTLGTVNGSAAGPIVGPNLLFQADATQSFTTAKVPEPGSLALIGLALAGLGAVARRRKA